MYWVIVVVVNIVVELVKFIVEDLSCVNVYLVTGILFSRNLVCIV